MHKLSIQIGSNFRYDDVEGDFNQFLDKNQMLIKSLEKLYIKDRF